MTKTTDLNIVGNTGADIVELSHALSVNSTVDRTIDLKDDSANDVLVFNADENNTDFTTFNKNGTVSNNKATFKFSKINNFDAVNGSNVEDKFGIFYSGAGANSGESMMSSFVEVTATINPLAYQLTDGRVYEDQLAGKFSKENAAKATYIRTKISNIISSGGIEAGGDTIGSAKMDFTYIAYGHASDGSDKTSVYAYTANYDSTVGQNAYNSIDASKLQIAGVAEITNVTQNEILMGDTLNNFVKEKPSGL